MTGSVGEVVNTYVQAWKAGDLPAIFACYHDDFTIHYGGASPLAGAHRGGTPKTKPQLHRQIPNRTWLTVRGAANRRPLANGRKRRRVRSGDQHGLGNRCRPATF